VVQARSFLSSASSHTVESGIQYSKDDAQLERAMADIEVAKGRNREQRIRSFCNASSLGNIEILSRLLNSGVNVNGTDANGRTALMLATCSGNLEVG